MAENESLDLSSREAKRWYRVCQAIRGGQPVDAVARRIEESLYGGLRAAAKQLNSRGLDFCSLFAAAQVPGELEQVLPKARGHDYARLLGDVAASTEDRSVGRMTREFVEAVWERVQDQLGQFVVPSDGCGSFPELYSLLNELSPRIGPVLDRLAERWAADPSQVPRKPPRPRPAPEATLDEQLQESLLGLHAR